MFIAVERETYAEFRFIFDILQVAFASDYIIGYMNTVIIWAK